MGDVFEDGGDFCWVGHVRVGLPVLAWVGSGWPLPKSLPGGEGGLEFYWIADAQNVTRARLFVSAAPSGFPPPWERRPKYVFLNSGLGERAKAGFSPRGLAGIYFADCWLNLGLDPGLCRRDDEVVSCR